MGRRNILCLTCCLILYLIFLQIPTNAQGVNDPTIRLNFGHLSVNNGLSESSVLSILQDKYGFLWFGTRNGLNKYNGYEFKIFRHKVNDSNSIAGNFINDIAEDTKGNVWVITDKGLSKYIRKMNIFRNYKLPKDKYRNSAFRSILIDSHSRIWVGGLDGLYIFNPQKETFYKKSYSYNIKTVSVIKEDRKGNIWIGADKFNVYKINTNKNKIIRVISNQKYPAINSRVEALVTTDSNKVWIGTYGDGLFLIGTNGELIEHFSSGQKNNKKKITNDYIRALQIDNNGNLWIGTFSGLNIIKNRKVINTISHIKGDPNSLAHNSIRSLLKDKKGTIWIGTYFGGVNMFDQNNQKFHHFYTIPGNLNSISYDVVGAFTEAPNGDIIIGTERGGINIKKENNQIIRKGRGKYANSTIKSLYTDKKGHIWAGVFKHGLYLFDKKSGKLKGYPRHKGGNFHELSKAIINCIAEDNNGFLWLGMDDNGGLYQFNLATRKFRVYPFHKKLQKLLGNTPVKDIVITGSGVLILATKGKGVISFNPETGYINQYEKYLEFNSVFEDSYGILWLASNGEGIFSLDEKGRIKQYDVEDGLISNIILGVLEDNAHHLWFISTNGLSRMAATKTGIFKNYPCHSYFPLDEINEGAFFKSESGIFYIGGSNGFVYFYPQSLQPNQFIPPVVLTQLSVLNKPVSQGDKTGLLQDELNETKSLTLNYNQSILTISFASLNYVHPENNEYAYKLKGFENEWVYSGKRRSVTYTNLSPGDYTFKVKGSNNDGVWNNKPLELAIKVLPPPWKTWWAYCIYAVFILSVLLIIRRNGIKKLQLKHHLKMEQFELKKWKEFHNLKIQYFTDISHELRTPLTLILSPLEELMDKKDKDSWLQSRLKIIFFNVRRLKLLVDQILEIRQIESGHSTLNLNPLPLSDIIRDIVDSFVPLADKKGIHLIYDDHNLPKTSLLLDQDKIQKIFYNLLINAFKYTEEGGEISVSGEYRDNRYHFEVRDTGCGMNEEELKKIFVRFYKDRSSLRGTGLGLALTQSLIKVMNGKISVSSEEGKGTNFKMELPFDTAVGSHTNETSMKPFDEFIPLDFHVDEFMSLEGNGEKDEDRKCVLIVEDNRDIRNYLKEQLSNKYKIYTAENGETGLKIARKIGINLIISDLMMPKMDGHQLLKEVKSHNELSHIPVVVLTAKDTQINKIEGLEQGADDYLTKPFHVRELKARIKNILKNRELLHEKYRNNKLLPDFGDFNSFDEKLLVDIIKEMKDNLDNPDLNVDFLCKKMALSRVHLYRKIKALTNMTPTDFIIDFKIRSACEMLETGKFRVSDVAYAVGYRDAQYFSKSFKKKMGISPTSYIKSKEK